MSDDEQTPRQYLTDFLLEQIDQQPLRRQVMLYRCVAIETADAQLARECRQSADSIERTLQSTRQMRLKFRARTQ